MLISLLLSGILKHTFIINKRNEIIGFCKSIIRELELDWK